MRTCLFLLAIFLLIVPLSVAAFFGVVIFNNLSKNDVILRDGLATNGEVTKVTEDGSTTVNGEHPFYVEFKYTVNATEKSDKDDVWKKPGEDITIGQKVGVKYQGDSAVLTDFKQVDLRILGLIPLVVGLPFAGIGFILFIVLLFTGSRRTV